MKLFICLVAIIYLNCVVFPIDVVGMTWKYADSVANQAVSEFNSTVVTENPALILVFPTQSNRLMSSTRPTIRSSTRTLLGGQRSTTTRRPTIPQRRSTTESSRPNGRQNVELRSAQVRVSNTFLPFPRMINEMIYHFPTISKPFYPPPPPSNTLTDSSVQLIKDSNYISHDFQVPISSSGSLPTGVLTRPLKIN